MENKKKINKRFDNLDTDNDGVISEEEYAAAAACSVLGPGVALR